VDAGDAVKIIARDEDAVSVADIVGLYTADGANQDLLRRATKLAALPKEWRVYFEKRLWEPDA
jgi:MOSC domain-containing protein YiiM